MELLITIMSWTAGVCALSASYIWLHGWAYQQGYEKGEHEGFVRGLNKQRHSEHRHRKRTPIGV